MMSEIKYALLAFLRHLALASLMTFVALLVIERLMPGSVLPFMDLVDWLLPTAGLTLIVTSLKTAEGLLNRIFQISLICLMALGGFALWATRLPDLGLINLLSLVAGALALVGWFLGAIKPEA